MATITKRGPRSFQARIRRKGYPTLARTFDTRADARRWITAQEHFMDIDSLPATLVAQQTPLKVALDDYRENETPAHRGADVEACRLLAMARSSIAELPLAKLNAIVIETYIEKRLESVGPFSVNRELSILVQVFKRARKQGWMIHDPMRDVRRPKNPPGRKRRLNEKEREAFKSALKKTRNKLFKLLLTVAHETGMRRGELLSTDWPQTDLQERVIRLRADQTKNGEARDVPLTRTAIAALYWIRRKTGDKHFVFHGVTAEAVKKCWKRLCERADITDFHFHDLRHERISSLIDAGWTHIQAMAVSGHKDLRAFSGYAHPKTKMLIDKLDELDSR